jgi:hypothetical protein
MKKTILVLGVLVSMISCKKENPQPAPTPDPITIPTPDPTPTPDICETYKKGELEIKNTTEYPVYIYIDNVLTDMMDGYTVRKIDWVNSGSHIIKTVYKLDDTIFNVYTVTIYNCEITSITI